MLGDRRARSTPVSPWVVFVIVAAGQLLVIVDLTVVFTALPSIQADLGLSDIQRQWVVNAYVLLFAGCLMLGGRLADLLGKRRVFVAGVVLFTATSLTNALAPDGATLIASRALQGLGAALLAPSALSIVTATFPAGPRRATAMAAWGGVAAAGAGVGVLVGGGLTQAISWEWVFLVNLPVGAVAILASFVAIPADAPPQRARGSFDLGGAVTVTAGLGLLVMAIVEVETAGWLGLRTLVAATGAVVLLSAFVGIERGRDAALVPLPLLRSRMLVISNVGALVIYGASAGVLYFLSLHLQQVLAWEPFAAGAAFIPFLTMVLLSAFASERLAPRVGLRLPLLVGPVVAAVGVLMLTQIAPGGSYAGDVLPGLLVFGVGSGMCFGPLTFVANNSLRDDAAGLASGLYNTATQIGAVLTIAVLSTVAESARPEGGDPMVALTDGFAAAFAVQAVVLVLVCIVGAWAFRRRELAAMTAEPAVRAPVAV